MTAVGVSGGDRRCSYDPREAPGDRNDHAAMLGDQRRGIGEVSRFDTIVNLLIHKHLQERSSIFILDSSRADLRFTVSESHMISIKVAHHTRRTRRVRSRNKRSFNVFSLSSVHRIQSCAAKITNEHPADAGNSTTTTSVPQMLIRAR